MREFTTPRRGEAVRDHERLGAAVRRGGEQFEGAATVGLGAVARAAVRLGHGGATGGEPGPAGYHAARACSMGVWAGARHD